MIVKEYFTDKELACPCGCGTMPNTKAVERLYAARLILDTPIHVMCGARCTEYNQYIGGVEKSYHTVNVTPARLKKSAFDIRVSNVFEHKVIKILMNVGFTGFGFRGNGSMHIDCGPERVWIY